VALDLEEIIQSEKPQSQDERIRNVSIRMSPLNLKYVYEALGKKEKADALARRIAQGKEES
jgi:hypothetical protein